MGARMVIAGLHATGLAALPTASGGIARLAYARCANAGIKVDPLLRKAGLTPLQIGNPQVRITVRSQIKFLDDAAKALSDDFLGLHLAQTFDLREIGLLYYVMASSELVGDALQRCAHYSLINNEGVQLIYRSGKQVAVGFKYMGVARHSDRHQIEFFMATLVRICQQLTGYQLQPQRVTLTHLRPDASDELKKHLGCAVVFGGSVDEITFPKMICRMPVSSADPYLNELLRKYCDEVRATRHANIGALRSSIENIIVPLLPHKKIRSEEIATALGLSRRTLARRLASEGLSFSEILHELRYDLARRYLSEVGLSISTIAWLLGYDEVSSFTHAFKRWAGTAPKQARSAEE
jgi:AraC-like DNA-binding protein